MFYGCFNSLVNTNWGGIKAGYSSRRKKLKWDLDCHNYKEVYLSTRIQGECNKLLSEAASRSGRTKTQEAQLRLHDHLLRFASIAELRKAEEREV